MPVTEIGDPRLQALFGANDPRDVGVRPTVRLPRKGLPPIAIAIVALLLGVLLFSVLNARRTGQAEPEVKMRGSSVSVWDAPPPLYIPPAPAQPIQQPAAVVQPAPLVVTMPAPRVVPQSPPAPIVYAPPPVHMNLPSQPGPTLRAAGGAPLVIDTTVAAAGSGSGAAPSTSPLDVNQGGGRMRASAFANRSTTVPQGYLIPAVLETGFDSTQPGFARAIVSRDVRGFDGKNVLIPRGSRLIGEYRSEVAQGQNRAIITWTRLMRPDGMTIVMDSPAVDTLGRGGVPAAVNTHFFQRLGDALLQSTVELGRTFAGRAITGPVVVIPGNTIAGAAPAPITNNYVPTLSVPAGKSISVFVAHDLDFSATEARR